MKIKESNPTNESYKKSTSPFSKNLWSDTISATEALTKSTITSSTTTTESTLHRSENTNPNMLDNDNERLLMLQRFASNNYCSSDESEDSFGTDNKQN